MHWQKHSYHCGDTTISTSPKISEYEWHCGQYLKKWKIYEKYYKISKQDQKLIISVNFKITEQFLPKKCE